MQDIRIRKTLRINEKNLIDMDVTCSAPMHVVSSEDKPKVNKELKTKKD